MRHWHKVNAKMYNVYDTNYRNRIKFIMVVEKWNSYFLFQFMQMNKIVVCKILKKTNILDINQNRRHNGKSGHRSLYWGITVYVQCLRLQTLIWGKKYMDSWMWDTREERNIDGKGNMQCWNRMLYIYLMGR